MVAACRETDALLDELASEQAGFELERVADAGEAITRVENGELADVVLLGSRLDDPVRVAQRLHSLDRDGAVIVLSDPEGAEELRHALEVAPFLDGDVSVAVIGDADGLAERLSAAVSRTRYRRDEAATRTKRRETPPPLSARYLGTLLDSVPIGLVTLDDSAAVIGWNRRAGEMLGVPEVEALGKPFPEMFASDDHERLAGLIAELGSAGIEDEGEIFGRADRAFELTGARFAIRSGESGALLILQDVTKRERAEQELRLQRALSDAQAETSEVGIVVTDLAGEIERANSRFAEIWGIDRDLLHSDRQAAQQRISAQVADPQAFLAARDKLEASDPGEFRDEVQLTDGRVIARYATHVREPGGELIGRIWFHTDITAQRTRENSLRFLADATNLLSSSLDYEVTLERIAELAVPQLADWCSVEIADQVGHHTVAVAHADPQKVALARQFRQRYPDVDSGAVALAIRSGEPQHFPELHDADVERLARGPEHLEMLRMLGLRSAMIVPIKVRERVFGAINFIRSRPGNPFDEADLRLAEELARRAAIAIDNSRVHAELRETARTLQESLLPPHLPAARGLELAARFRPAGVGMQVGGDFYDVFEVGPDRWGVAVGDVCGKGAQAAALTALTRYTVRTAAMYEDEPGGVLRVLNEALQRQRGDFRFTTLAFCILDLGSERCTLRASSAGHPKPLLLRPDGTAEVVGAGGPLLGVLPDLSFGHLEVELEQGDLLVLYTDGLTDALAPRHQLSDQDLMTALADCHGLSAGEVSLRLEEVALGPDPDATPRDDIALVVAKLV